MLALETEGGAAPYEYRWSDGAAGARREGLGAGGYTVTVTDANGCETVLENIQAKGPEAALRIALSYKNNVSCFGSDDGALGVDARGGTPPYLYEWQDGKAGEDRKNLAGGVYALTVTDVNGCVVSRTFEVGAPGAALRVEASFIQHESCAGANDGAVGAEVMGGKQPYAYFWSNGARSQDAGNLPPGRHTLLARDAGGCVVVRQFEIEAAKPLLIDAEVRHSTCDDNGAIIPNVKGGKPPYTYRWTNGSSAAELRNIPPGVYGLNLTDGNGCATAATFEAEDREYFAVELQEARNPSCYGKEDGSISVNVVGGVPPFNYMWGSGASGRTATGLGIGEHVLAVEDAAGCIAAFTYRLTEPPLLAAEIGISVPVACSGRRDGALGLNARGGTPLYTYRWSNGARTQDLQNVGPGLYRVTVTDAAGCQAYAEGRVEEAEPLVLKLSDKQAPKCAGGSDGLLRVEAEGGKAPYVYFWTDGGAPGDMRADLSAGVYQAFALDANGCLAQAAFHLEEPEPLTLSAEAVSPAGCNTGAAATASAQGGTAPYDYLWSSGANAKSVLSLPPGAHSVTATDANGCSSTAEVLIAAPAAKTAQIAAVGGPLCLDAPPVALEALPGGGQFSGPGVTDGLFNPSIAGPGAHDIRYERKVGSCVYAGSTTIRVYPPAQVNATGVAPSCKSCANGLIIATAAGAGPFRYRLDGGQWQTNGFFAGLAVGSYVLEARDANSCSVTKAVELAPRRSRFAQKDENARAEVAVYPNPSDGRFSVAIEQAQAGAAELAIYDMSGRRVWTNSYQLSTEDAATLRAETGLPAGVYWLEARGDGRLLGRAKVVIQ